MGEAPRACMIPPAKNVARLPRLCSVDLRLTVRTMLSDTSLEALATQQEIFRRMTAAERLRLALEMSESVRNIALAGLRRRRPELDAAGLQRELMRVLYGFVMPS